MALRSIVKAPDAQCPRMLSWETETEPDREPDAAIPRVETCSTEVRHGCAAVSDEWPQRAATTQPTAKETEPAAQSTSVARRRYSWPNANAGPLGSWRCSRRSAEAVALIHDQESPCAKACSSWLFSPLQAQGLRPRSLRRSCHRTATSSAGCCTSRTCELAASADRAVAAQPQSSATSQRGWGTALGYR